MEKNWNCFRAVLEKLLKLGTVCIRAFPSDPTYRVLQDALRDMAGDSGQEAEAIDGVLGAAEETQDVGA